MYNDDDDDDSDETEVEKLNKPTSHNAPQSTIYDIIQPSPIVWDKTTFTTAKPFTLSDDENDDVRCEVKSPLFFQKPRLDSEDNSWMLPGASRERSFQTVDLAAAASWLTTESKIGSKTNALMSGHKHLKANGNSTTERQHINHGKPSLHI